MELKDLVRTALRDSVDYPAYREEMARQVQENRTSGPAQTEALIGYTRLNHQRMKRWEKRFRPDESIAGKLRALDKPTIWLVLSETWCGDAAPVLPVMRALEMQSPKLALRIANRDDHPDLIDRFQTDGTIAIPKLLALDPTTLSLKGSWGPRPEEPMGMVRAYKEKHGKLSPEFRESLQQWYNKDKGCSIAAELEALLTLEEVGNGSFLDASR